MSVDPGIVDHIADLAKLELDSDERVALGDQLTRVLDFVAQLDEVDVDDVPPTKHVIEQANVGRVDEERPSLPRDEALASAPDADEGHFVVPKVLPTALPD